VTTIAFLNHSSYFDLFSDLAVVLPNLVEDRLPVVDLLDIVVTRVPHPRIAPLHLADFCQLLVSTSS
jgi:hypothetical protein